MQAALIKALEQALARHSRVLGEEMSETEQQAGTRPGERRHLVH